MKEQPRESVFFVLDFDRLLVDSDHLGASIYREVEKLTGVTADVIMAEQRLAEARHDEDPTQTIDMWSTILRLVGDAIQSIILRQKVVEATQHHKKDFYLPGALQLLDWLQALNVPFAIITKGEAEWQSVKLQCVGLQDIPSQVVSSWNKAGYVNAWRSGGSFLIPADLGYGNTLLVNNVVIVDDRAAAFQGADKNIIGARILTGRDKGGEVPSWIYTFSSITDALPILKSYI